MAVSSKGSYTVEEYLHILTAEGYYVTLCPVSALWGAEMSYSVYVTKEPLRPGATTAMGFSYEQCLERLMEALRGVSASVAERVDPGSSV